MDKLKAVAAEFPGLPGVYIMKNSSGKVIYVGKAINLKKRVSSYFLGKKDPKTSVLVKKISTIEHIVTDSEYEALLLENILIKKYNPRYNIRLKDGKTYPVIRITNEEFPQVFKTRRIIRDGSKYFGPFASAGLLNVYMDTIEKIFPLRRCRGALKKRQNPCLYYHIGRCSAPCAGKISAEDYGGIIAQVEELISGDSEDLKNWLNERMQEASEKLEFEKAAGFRDAIIAAESIENEAGQNIIDFNEITRDYIACDSWNDKYTFTVLQMRGGKLTGRELFRNDFPGGDEEAFEQFVVQFYSDGNEIPRQLYFSKLFDTVNLKNFFISELEHEVEMFFPENGRHFSVVKMAEENARQDILKRKKDAGDVEGLERLKETLGLKKIPARIEGFDIAQLSGKYPVASLISFVNGIPDKTGYRHFNLKTLDGKIDDFASVREAVTRRYTRVLNEDQPRPDLVLIDGGPGQVSAARGVLNALGLEDIPVIGLAKKNEEIYMDRFSKPLNLPEGDPALKILQYVRDETHRFATGLNKKHRERDSRFSLLEDVSGIGPAKSRKLMETYGSLKGIAAAGRADVARTAGISEAAAEALFEKINNEKI